MGRSRRRMANVTKRLCLESLEQRYLLAAAGLVSHWPLDIRDSGSTLRDEVGTNHLNAIGQLLYQDSELGRAIVRNGTGSPGAPLSNFEPNLGGFGDGVTVSAWINRSSDFGGFAFAISPLGVQLGTEGNVLHFNASTTAINGATIDNRVEGVFEFQNDAWYHIAGTYNGERLVIYINGDDVASSVDASGSLQMDGRLYVGSGWTPTDSSIRDFRGQLDDVKLFNRALTPQQILALSRSQSALETSNEPSVYQGEPVTIAPGAEISSERLHFGGGALQASFDPPTAFREGDLIYVATTERISVENGGVFFSREGLKTRIGEVGDFASHSLRIDLNQNATPAATEALARALKYSASADNPESHDRLLTISLSTQEGVTSFADVRKIVFGQTNTLILETSAGASEYVVGGDSIIVDPIVEVASSGENFSGGSLNVSFVEASGRESDQLFVRPTSSITVVENTVLLRGEGPPVVIGTFGGGENGNPLVINLNENSNSQAAQTLSRAIVYQNTAEVPPDHPRFVRFTLNDEKGGETADVKKIEFVNQNVSPDIVVPEGTTQFLEGSEPAPILPSVSIIDPDSVDFSGGSLGVAFAEGSVREGDRLSIQNSEAILIDGNNVYFQTSDPPLRVGEVDLAENGRTLVVHLNQNANAEVAELIALAVQFGNNSVNPETGIRLVRFELSDGDNGSDAGVRSIEVSQLNDPPVVQASEGAAVYTEGSEAVIIDSRIEIGDSGSDHFGGSKLIVSFAEASHQEGDFLGLRDSESVAIEGNDIFLGGEGQSTNVASFRFDESSLIIDFTESAGVAVAQQVARRVTFGSALDQVIEGNRFIQFTVMDASGESGSDIRRAEVASVNDLPVIEFSDGAADYTEGSEPIFVDPQVQASDPDSTHFANGKLIASFVEQSRREGDYLGLRASETILIQGNDILFVDGGQSTTVAEFGLNEGVLVVEFNENASSTAVQEVSRRITFGNELNNIIGEDRFVRFAVIDADGGDASDVRRIAVNLLNDAPDVQAGVEVNVFEVWEDPAIVAPHIEIGDSDSENFGGGSLVITIVEQTGADGDTLGIRAGDGIVVDGNRVLVSSGDSQLLVGEIREASPEAVGLAIDLTEHSTPELTQQLARQITFRSTATVVGDNDVRLVRFAVADGDGGQGADVMRIELLFQGDVDLDGVDDIVEDAAPNEGDGNRDGIPDSEQDRVASVRGAEDRFVTIASPENTRLVDVQLMDDPSPVDHPEETEFPVGFFDFTVEGVESTEATMVTVHLDPSTGANSFYVFGPTPDDANPHWYPFHFDGPTGAKIYADRIELYYMDGQRGDSDLSVNGIIADPGAPAIAIHPWQNPIDSADVNNDGSVTALDALLIINDLARYSSRYLPVLPEGTVQLAERFLDVSGDNQSSTLDALQVINKLARNLIAASASGESISGLVLTDDDEEPQWVRAIDEVVRELF